MPELGLWMVVCQGVLEGVSGCTGHFVTFITSLGVFQSPPLSLVQVQMQQGWCCWEGHHLHPSSNKQRYSDNLVTPLTPSIVPTK